MTEDQHSVSMGAGLAELLTAAVRSLCADPLEDARHVLGEQSAAQPLCDLVVQFDRLLQRFECRDMQNWGKRLLFDDADAIQIPVVRDRRQYPVAGFQRRVGVNMLLPTNKDFSALRSDLFDRFQISIDSVFRMQRSDQGVRILRSSDPGGYRLVCVDESLQEVFGYRFV